MWVSSSAHVAHRSMFYPTFLCRGPGAHAACRELVDAWEIRCTFILGTLTTPRAYQKCVVSIATTTTTTTTCGGLSPAYVSLVAGRPPLVSLCHVNCRLCVCVFMWNCSYNYNYKLRIPACGLVQIYGGSSSNNEYCELQLLTTNTGLLLILLLLLLLLHRVELS